MQEGTEYRGMDLTRRQFVRLGLMGSAAVLASPWNVLADEAKKPQLWVIKGKDKAELMRHALETIARNGGLGDPARTLALKVNAAWAREPEVGANTHPELISEFIKRVLENGTKKVVVPENPCHRPAQSFTKSGVKDAVESAGGTMIDLRANKDSFQEVKLNNGQTLKKAKMAGQFLDAAVTVNMPVAKHHAGATMTVGMKNWMGAVHDRGFWHRNGLHKCIADFTTFFRPQWTIIDATTVMPDHGPIGPSKNLKQTNRLIVTRDPVAGDAYTTTLFRFNPKGVRYLALASKRGMGVVDPAEMTVHTVDL